MKLFEPYDLDFNHWLDFENGPLLVLGIHEGHRHEPKKVYYRAREGREFLAITHQTAGHACNHHSIFGTVLRVRPEMVKRVAKIVRKYEDSYLYQPTLDDLVSYRYNLAPLDLCLDCNLSYRHLEEAILPIDCTPVALDVLTDEELPVDLDDLIEWSDEMGQWYGLVDRWHLFILFENSD